jgi:hypothetical protein
VDEPAVDEPAAEEPVEAPAFMPGPPPVPLEPAVDEPAVDEPAAEEPVEVGAESPTAVTSPPPGGVYE